MTSASAVIVAAGCGVRMGAEVRKAFLPLAGRPLFVHAVEVFVNVPRIAEIVVVVHPDDIEAARAAVAAVAPQCRFAVGGTTRCASSLAGIRTATQELVLIHDGCRPFVSRALIERVLDAADRHGAALPVLPAVETLYRIGEDRSHLAERVDRESIVRAQTPQGFRRELVLKSLEIADAAITDDASAVLALGAEVAVLDGESANCKITFAEDLAWGEDHLARIA